MVWAEQTQEMTAAENTNVPIAQLEVCAEQTCCSSMPKVSDTGWVFVRRPMFAH